MNDPTVLSLRRSWSGMRAPDLDELVGQLEASFVTPLKRLAPAGLGVIGLPNWYGKRFEDAGGHLTGTNLVRTASGLVQTLAMSARVGTSLTDGLPAVVIGYSEESPRPWRWVRDEVRARPDGSYLGMTFVDLPVLRSLGGTPFLLTPA